MIGVSSCLAGVKCTFRGDDNLIEIIKEMVARKEAVMICPEVLGGMSIPRNPCEIRNGKVIDITGDSPSCGKNKIYDGSFTHTLIDGDGITCQMLEKNGIMVFNENEINEFFEFIEKRRVENGSYFKG